MNISYRGALLALILLVGYGIVCYLFKRRIDAVRLEKRDPFVVEVGWTRDRYGPCWYGLMYEWRSVDGKLKPVHVGVTGSFYDLDVFFTKERRGTREEQIRDSKGLLCEHGFGKDCPACGDFDMEEGGLK